MKMLNLCIALMFSLTFCLAAAPVDSYAKAGDTTSNVEKTVAKAVNVNTADKEMLTQIPGVGPVTADAIMEYREANGKFKSADELMNVKGIGEKTIKKMKPFLEF